MADPGLGGLSLESEFLETVILSGKSLADVCDTNLLVCLNLRLLRFSIVS